MVGDDVVDLRDPETRASALHPRFDARVFCEDERRAIAASDSPHRLRWALWAAKESAYKIARKRDARAVFAPSRFRALLQPDGGGRVAFGALCARLRISEAGGALHAVATLAGGTSRACVTRVMRVDPAAGAAAAGAAARSLAVQALAPLLGADPGELAVARERRIPRLLLRGAHLAADLSLSHHGRFVSFACELEVPEAPR